MSQDIVDANLNSVLKQIPCPLCKFDKSTALYPSLKFSSEAGTYLPHPEICIAVCDNCGLVFENPQVLLEESHAYADGHYYNKANPVAQHNKGQKMWNIFRWHILQHKLPWEKVKKALDIGASGAWSNWVLQKTTDSESVLIEPSSAAVTLCKETYPNVRAELGTIDQFDDIDGSYDLISSFYSLYMFPDPLKSLKKIRRLLKPDGTFLVCISNLYLELEIWTGDSPWLNLSQLVRAILLIYYSRQTLKKLFAASGFVLVEEFVFEFPKCHEWRGRQEAYFLLRPGTSPVPNATPDFFHNPEEREKAIYFFTNLPEIGTENSVRQFFSSNSVNSISLVHDGDEAYTNWVIRKLEGYISPIQSLGTKPRTLEDLAGEIEDANGTFILLAGEHRSNATNIQSRFQKAKVIDCSLPVTDNYYGNYIEGQNGKVIITRAFCPEVKHGSPLFPYVRRDPANDIDIDPAEIEGFLELVAEQRNDPEEQADESASDAHPASPNWAELISEFAASLDHVQKRILLMHFHTVAAEEFLRESHIQTLEDFITDFDAATCQSLIDHVFNNAPPETVQKLLEHVIQLRDQFKFLG